MSTRPSRSLPFGTPVNARLPMDSSPSDAIPLHPVVVQHVWESLAGRPDAGPNAPLFPLRTPGGFWRKTAKMMNADLRRAGLPYQDEAGL